MTSKPYVTVETAHLESLTILETILHEKMMVESIFNSRCGR